MFYNPITFVITLICVNLFVLFYTLFALISSHKITNFISKKKTFLSGLLFICLIISFLYIIKLYVLQYLVNNDKLCETAFIMIGPIIAIFILKSKDSHINKIIDVSFKLLKSLFNYLHIK